MTAAQKLLKWYRENARPLPWRETKDPYSIWISEVMLQQTTVTAVLPFYEKFLKAFPTIQALAEADIEEVYEYWAGLGYYSRARNLHKASQWLNSNGFPTTHEELIELPGFGPYTARAVASLAFEQNVGVLDGNVIRFLSRLHDLDTEWWTGKGRSQLQQLADEFVAGQPASDINQSLIEIGATVCTPKSPACLLCPLMDQCVAMKNKTVDLRPTPKPQRNQLLLLWQVDMHHNRGKVKFVENDYAPFLKSHAMLPGRVVPQKKPPDTYDFIHFITHYKIYVQVKRRTGSGPPGKWLNPTEVTKENPSSLVKKTLSLDVQ